MNKISGTMSGTLTAITNLNGKYIKVLLSKLEEQNVLTPLLRKFILDTMNDYHRELLKELGYDTQL